MEFKQTRSQIEIVKAARDFARSEFDKEQISEWDRKSEFPIDIQQKAAELGFTSIHFDENCLGGGLGFLENVLMAEELCRKDSTLGSALMLSTYGADLLNRFGSEELKSRYLSIVAEGKMMCGTGADAFHLESGPDIGNPTAVKSSDAWVIDGEIKTVINGGQSGFYLIICTTDPMAGPENRFSLILVESDREGINVVETGPKLGLRMTSVTDLKLAQVRVPLNNIIGQIGNGWQQMATFRNDSCLLLAAMAVGIGQGVIERAVNYVKQRDQFDRKIATFQITRHKIARMALIIEQARALTYRAAWQNDQKKQDPSLCSMAKLAATGAALDCAHEAIQLHGGYGYTSEYEVERFCRDAKTLHLLAESPGRLNDDIADNLIGKMK